MTLAEVAATGGGLDAPEAVALLLAVADKSQASAARAGWRALPSAEHIRLDASGRVSIASLGDEIDERGHVKMLAGLLASLVGVDDPGLRNGGPRAPGGLLVLIARASGTMDLPVPSYAAFRDALLRFGSTDELTLASVYARCMAQRSVPALPSAQPAAVVPVRARLRDPLPDEGVYASAPSTVSQPPEIVPVPLGRARTAAAAVLALAAMAASFAIGLKLTAPEAGRGSATTIGARPAAQDAAESDRIPEAPWASATFRGPGVTSSQHPQAIGVSVSPILSAAAIGADVFSPSFIEQGRALLFHSGRARSSLMRLSFDERGQPSVAMVLQDGASNYHAVRSPDGKWLAYDSNRDGTRSVYVARADGRESRKVSGDGYAAIPHWSLDGRRLAFIKAEPQRPNVWNVWLADLGGHSLTRVSHHAVGQAWSASWFPGGTRLAYSVEDRLIIEDLARATTRVIPSPRPGHLVRTPAVSPDGQWVMFQVHRDGVWLLEVATGRMRRLLADATAEEFAWSPDSRRVVYHTHRDGGWSLWQLAFDRPA